MPFPAIDPLRAFVLACILIPVGYFAGEGYITWILTREWIFYLNSRDYYTAAFGLLPTAMGHVATIWGHYFRAEREFQHSITKVTTPVSVKQKISLWEHHIFWGYTVKYWILVAVIVLLNCGWVLISDLPYAKEQLEEYGLLGGLGLLIGQAGGYGAIACCGIILFLVLRRSMLHALGFTYAEILPLHRWLGVLIVVWSVLHTIGYVMYYVWAESLGEVINFYDIGRATMNLMGCIALGALLILAVFSLPQVRRRFYTLFMSLHRVMTVVFFVATVVHYPYYLLWYYVLPSIVLFFVDRFVPKTIQARTLYPEATCTLNADADIIKMTFKSPEPMKPYYPGDYIMVQVPELGTLYHPFTIASYWPEDPRAIVLFIRTYGENPRSWTGAMSRLCGNDDKRIRVKANVDGVFGDRRHDYLKSEVLVVFVAGAAITTFMALIKAIAAQIAASTDPLRMQFHLICTFRTRSELHAYGSFLHQITRDPRFTSWLHVEIYVSRPDKPNTLMGPHAHVIKNDIMVPGQSVAKSKKKRFQSLRRTGTRLKRALSGRTVVEQSSADEKQKTKVEPETTEVSSSVTVQHVRSLSLDTVVESDKEKDDSRRDRSGSSSGSCTSCPTPSSPMSATGSLELALDSIEPHTQAELTPSTPTRTMTYHSKRLPTFHDAQSASVATRFAKLDLHTTVILIVIPLAFWYSLRAIHWEGSPHYCDVMEELGATGDKICYGSYSMAPAVGHAVLVAFIGYLSMWLARKNLLRSLAAASKRDIESGKHLDSQNLPYPDLDIEDEKLSVEDGNWDEGDVVYSTGRMNVKVVIDRFMSNGVGNSGKDRGLVTVFGGGPEAFVEHVERQIKSAKWAVDFHRETWAP
ncbi:MAG: ferric reductase like transmembrane component-domain-containing protein [Benniella sp.]|nr:MAG: ferric reductase like transmembrane component-domain-containing protein [Benniella sp.]